MSRITIPTDEQTLAASKPLLAAVKQQLGVVPNLMKLVGHSPAALEGYLSLSGALSKGTLSAALRERIALAIAQYNGCDYCLSAHTYLGLHVAKLSEADIAAARDHHSTDPKIAAALHFAYRVAAERGRVSDADLTTLRQAGFGEAEIVEIVLVVALNVLTNYVNNVAQTDIDFPKVSAN
ncbi:carboxymuconolactone decarboxylase family protein [Pseudoduganella sp. DS3]|uniref:Carboxymuconolactone decarboxylase family protein n=1 Tax=Pseudoduganella guangdongensis TaxID=2692179 RepID=A0A6N9HL42_9BURK|nr:carboxymuconolactone decarboxylase family protein [Pseudoduganella guangdongensis]MYN04059.1 carboxymuconolactone decarboxylase family protein [Pseudoduganella guangdongensis]